MHSGGFTPLGTVEQAMYPGPSGHSEFSLCRRQSACQLVCHSLSVSQGVNGPLPGGVNSSELQRREWIVAEDKECGVCDS